MDSKDISFPAWNSTSAIPEENLKNLRFGKVYYELHGDESGPLVVLLHGITWWSFIWHPTLPFLTNNGFRVLIFDFYGRGNSDAPSTSYTAKFYMNQIDELLESLGFKETKFHLLGYSMGGMIATHYAKHNPNRLLSLSLVAPAVIPVVLPALAKLVTYPIIGYPLFYMFGKNAMLKTLQQLRLRDNFAEPEKHKELIDKLYDRTEWVLVHKAGYVDAFHSTLVNLDFGKGCLEELEVAMKETRYPVLVIWGQHDIVANFKHHTHVLDRVPKERVTFAPIPQAGHALWWENFDEVHAALNNFLKVLKEM